MILPCRVLDGSFTRNIILSSTVTTHTLLTSSLVRGKRARRLFETSGPLFLFTSNNNNGPESSSRLSRLLSRFSTHSSANTDWILRCFDRRSRSCRSIASYRLIKQSLQSSFRLLLLAREKCHYSQNTQNNGASNVSGGRTG